MRKRITVDKINKLPKTPGVYFLKNKTGEVFYIGKANNLRSRVATHARDERRGTRDEELHTNTVDWISCANEIEALIKEAEYIKKYQPKLNIRLRDDKQYFYVGIIKEELPRIFITHQPASTNNEQRTVNNKKILNTKYQIRNTEYIGPFTDGGALKVTMKYVRKLFPYYQTNAKRPLVAHMHKALPCSWCHIGQCPGPSPDKKQYRKNITAIKQILSGKKESALKKLQVEMNQAIKAQEFENAAKIRDTIEALKNIFSHSNIVIPWSPERMANRKWQMANRGKSPTEGKAISDFEPYRRPSGHGVRRSRTSEAEIEREQLAGRFDACEKLEDNRPPHYLACILKISSPVISIEGYDISNIQGKEPTASMVRFENGKPNKSLYRKFNIQAPPRPNDILMMREVIRRRFAHPQWPYPDLILIDGGRGQLNAARSELRKAGLNIPVVALAKRLEELYIPGRAKPGSGWYPAKPILLQSMPQETSNLLKHIRDESHRFAVSHHRQRHRKSFQK